MKYIFTFLLFTLTSVTVLAQEKKSYPESGFSASFPASLKVEKTPIDSQLGKIDMSLYLAEGDDYMIMVSENKYPSDFLQKAGASGIKGMLNGAKNGALNNLAKQMQSKYEETSSEEFSFDTKYPGNKFSGSVSGIAVSGQIFMRNNQMYQILVMGNTAAADVTTFLKSFTLIE